jgi:hypothetical protein
MAQGSREAIAEKYSNRIKVLTLAYEAQFGRKPEALLVPGLMVLGLVTLAEELCGRLLDEGFVLDSINGMSIRLVTGNRLGVGILSGDPASPGSSTPMQEALWLYGDGSGTPTVRRTGE